MNAAVVDEVRPMPSPARAHDYSNGVDQLAAIGLLSQLGTHSRQQQGSREDLLAWLDEKERASSPLVLPQTDKLAREAGQEELADVVDGAVSKHQEAAEVCTSLAHAGCNEASFLHPSRTELQTGYGPEAGRRQ